MALLKETVAIPLASGIQPSARARLLEPLKLLEAKNVQFVQDQGPQKRNGHEAKVVRTNANYPGLNGIEVPGPTAYRDNFSKANPGLPTTWLYGWGINGTELATSTNPFEVSPQPDVGQLFGSATRDSEVLQWDGHRVFSYAPNQVFRFGETQTGSAATVARGPACMPALRAAQIAKISDAQLVPDAADNGIVRLVAWLNSDGVTGAYSVFDSTNGAALVTAQSLTFQTPKSLRVVNCGPWFHILVSDTAANALEMRSFHQDSPNTIISRSLGTVDIQFDVKKIDESKYVVIKSKGGVITAFINEADGNTTNSFVPALGGFAATTNLAIACEVDRNGCIAIVWQTTGAPVVVNFATYNQGGATMTARQQVTTITAARRMTVAPRYMPINPANYMWDVFVEDLVATFPRITSFAVQAGGSTTTNVTRRRVVLASHAFRVGNRTFVWVAPWLFNGTLGLQSTWFLCDAALMPVGKMAYGQANTDFGNLLLTLSSVNWSAGDTPYKDRIVFHGAMGFNVRVPSVTSALSAVPNGVFTEPSIMFYELDFLPKLVAGQAGRTTYFAGAQLWSYDGAEMVEAGFHLAPEGVAGVVTAGGGLLTAGVYRYRVDLCHKNAQGEEVRSFSIITAPVTVANNDRITLTIPMHPMTRREDAYFLIFRTTSNGTLYKLANSRNPTSAQFLRNTQAADSFTYVDGLSDTDLDPRESHPGNAGGNYIDPLPAPACELVAAGRDRLWLAGGELASGEVAPSRLFAPGSTPAFSPALNIQVDRNAEPITAIGFVGEVTAVFRRTATYIIDSDGPDNSLNGTWAPARITVADTGAVSQQSLALTVVGLWFQSPAGFRLLNNNGVMDREAGMDVDPLVVGSHYSAAAVVPQYMQVRWYARDLDKPTIVVDYSTNAWSTWTGLTNVGAVFWPVTNLVVLAKSEGYVWVEEENLYTDATLPYEQVVRLAWLHGKQLGDFQRIRRFALFGEAEAPLNLRIRLFYDERPFHEEEMFVEFPINDPSVQGSNFNTSVWGGIGGEPSEWGTGGPWGDDQNAIYTAVNGVETNLYFEDRVFRFRKRPQRQKCSVFSIEFSDQSAPHSGFVPVVVALELGLKQGLDRIPT